MYEINWQLEGMAPFLFNKYIEMDSKSRPESEYLEIAKGRAHRDDLGIYIPQWTMKRVLEDGIKGAGIKERKKSIAPIVKATVFVKEPCRFHKVDVDFIHQVMGRVPPRTGSLVRIYRPAMETGWLLSGTFMVLDKNRDPNQLREGMDFAGLYVGLGGWRPEYGRFLVKAWEVHGL